MDANLHYVLQLYIADSAPNSVQARGNLRTFCRTQLAGTHQLEVIDVFEDPARALDDGIFMTPTLIKRLPLPVRRIVGTLSDSDAIREALGIEDDGQVLN
jgi:circadian clock protein KaiB